MRVCISLIQIDYVPVALGLPRIGHSSTLRHFTTVCAGRAPLRVALTFAGNTISTRRKLVSSCVCVLQHELFFRFLLAARIARILHFRLASHTNIMITHLPRRLPFSALRALLVFSHSRHSLRDLPS